MLQSNFTRVGLLVPRRNCGSSKPEAERGADLIFEFEFAFKKKPQSIDTTKPPRSCVGSELACQKRQLLQGITVGDYTEAMERWTGGQVDRWRD